METLNINQFTKAYKSEITPCCLDSKSQDKLENSAERRTWIIKPIIVEGPGTVLLKFNNIKAFLYKTGTCSNQITISLEVETVGWRPNGYFPVCFQLISLDAIYPLWQVDEEIRIECGNNFPLVIEEKIDTNIFELATYSLFSYPGGVNFYKC